MKKWEYTWFTEYYDFRKQEWFISYKREEKPNSERYQILNELGKEGWELIDIDSHIFSSSPRFETRVFTDTNKITYYFKRELKE